LNWHNDLALWNVYENNQYGKFDEGHYYDLPNPAEDKPRVNDCLVYGAKCDSEDGFNRPRPCFHEAKRTLSFTPLEPLRKAAVFSLPVDIFVFYSPKIPLMGLDVGGYHDRPDWPKIGPSLLIAT
jgi:hypothetical protein